MTLRHCFLPLADADLPDLDLEFKVLLLLDGSLRLLILSEVNIKTVKCFLGQGAEVRGQSSLTRPDAFRSCNDQKLYQLIVSDFEGRLFSFIYVTAFVDVELRNSFRPLSYPYEASPSY